MLFVIWLIDYQRLLGKLLWRNEIVNCSKYKILCVNSVSKTSEKLFVSRFWNVLCYKPLVIFLETVLTLQITINFEFVYYCIKDPLSGNLLIF